MKDAWMLREPRSHRLVAAGEVVGVGAEPSRKLLEPRVQEARRDCHLALVARERLQEPEEVHGDSLGKVLPAAESLALLLRGVQEGLEGHADPRTLRAGPPGGGALAAPLGQGRRHPPPPPLPVPSPPPGQRSAKTSDGRAADMEPRYRKSTPSALTYSESAWSGGSCASAARKRHASLRSAAATEGGTSRTQAAGPAGVNWL